MSIPMIRGESQLCNHGQIGNTFETKKKKLPTIKPTHTWGFWSSFKSTISKHHHRPNICNFAMKKRATLVCCFQNDISKQQYKQSGDIESKLFVVIWNTTSKYIKLTPTYRCENKSKQLHNDVNEISPTTLET